MQKNKSHKNLGAHIGEAYDEFRCKHCNKLLAKHDLFTAKLDFKCLRCGEINSILKDSSYLILITTKAGKIIYVNEMVKAITGFSASEVIGKTPALWGGQMPKEFYKKLWHEILEKKRAVVIQVTNKKKDGTKYQAVNRISPILNEKGEVDYFLGIQTIL